MNILVADATGAIGRPLISVLVSARHNVFGMTSSKLGHQTLKEDGAEGLLAGALDAPAVDAAIKRSEEHTSELQSRLHLVCRLLLEKKNKSTMRHTAVSALTGRP